MSTDTKALVAATPATVALVRRELDKSREAQRGGCGIPKAVKVDCAMVERLCRVAEKQADRLVALEAELASAREAERVQRERAERLAEALRGWWKAHRPVGWTEDQHRSCPHVNLATDAEKALATALLRDQEGGLSND